MKRKGNTKAIVTSILIVLNVILFISLGWFRDLTLDSSIGYPILIAIIVQLFFSFFKGPSALVILSVMNFNTMFRMYPNLWDGKIPVLVLVVAFVGMIYQLAKAAKMDEPPLKNMDHFMLSKEKTTKNIILWVILALNVLFLLIFVKEVQINPMVGYLLLIALLIQLFYVVFKKEATILLLMGFLNIVCLFVIYEQAFFVWVIVGLAMCLIGIAQAFDEAEKANK